MRDSPPRSLIDVNDELVLIVGKRPQFFAMGLLECFHNMATHFPLDCSKTGRHKGKHLL